MKNSSLKKREDHLHSRRKKLFELAVFPMLGAIMFCSKLLMEFLPNIHMVGMLVMLYTVVFRWRALIPIYIFVFLSGIYAGFDLWWIPYIYIWLPLFAITMLLPKKMPRGVAAVVYAVVCGLHGFLYGVLYAPAQALLFGLDFPKLCAWVIAGFPFDIMHGIGNIIFGSFVLPLSVLMKKLVEKNIGALECKKDVDSENR